MTDAREAAGIVVETDIMVRMRDGVHLACDIYRPASGGPVPALVQRQPYDKRVAQTYVYDHPAVYARHGYAVVIEDTRALRLRGRVLPAPSRCRGRLRHHRVVCRPALVQRPGRELRILHSGR